MALADMQRHADHFLRVANEIPQCVACGLIAVSDDAASLFLDLAVEMPTHWVAKGGAPNGVLAVERVEVTLRPDYPWRCPTFDLRADFPRDMAHLTPGSDNIRPTPCLVDGNQDEFFNQHGLLELGIGAIVNQMGIWLGRAALGTLMDPDHGWEPVMRQGLPDRLIIDADYARSQVTDKTGSVWLATRFAKGKDLSGKTGYTLSVNNELAAVFGDIKPFPFEPQGEDRYSGISVTVLIWPPKDVITSIVLPETVQTLDDLAKRAVALGCGAEFDRFLGRLELRWKAKTTAAVLPVAVVLCARRPFPLIGRDSTIELLPYLIEITAQPKRASLFEGPNAKTVVAMEQLDRTTPKLLRTVSAAPVFGPFSLVGCGSVGSKAALHLARAGAEILAVSDSTELRPHNMARHALVRLPLPWPKAFELAEELGPLGQKPEANLIDVVKALKRPEDRLKIAPAGTRTLINTTASSLVRDALSIVTPAELPARVAEIALFGRGRGAFVFHEGAARNPSLADLQTVLSATVTPYERTLLFDPAFGLAQIQIGEGCGSMTMPMTDARLSAMTATASEELMRLAIANAADGELVVGVTDPHSPSTHWRRLAVPKFLEIPVEGGEWTLRLSSDVARKIREEIAKYPKVETGGLLIGSCSSLRKTVTVVDLIDAPEDSVRMPTLFVLGTQGMKQRIDTRFEDSGRSLLDVGTWHSHLAEQGPSGTDRQTAKQVAAERAPPAILLIASPGTYHAIMHKEA
ncbi:Mov34/MPN/PAD-1 family protein [Mesorhizobium sp.]|uniref:Mov34/MPN/PAD-1 family protein n=1 Tax=Mesorhizobium sp. TaxID=1871066 RepID=UPI000FE4A074|nr:Mov34/MPN/PAD-1 family protein [Mesorhizobium sp.]RWF67346.1 MAG: hypothetical protein EOS47_02495 [Mesorhizobium sp.]TIT44554.1 MAG: hypothetical protein E5W76_01940 [Mesorhizobium sp.]